MFLEQHTLFYSPPPNFNANLMAFGIEDFLKQSGLEEKLKVMKYLPYLLPYSSLYSLRLKYGGGGGFHGETVKGSLGYFIRRKCYTNDYHVINDANMSSIF